MSEEQRLSAHLIAVLREHWMQVLPQVPAGASAQLQHWNGTVVGFCSHPTIADRWWVHSRGGKRFLADQGIPESFAWVGIHDRGGSAYLFVMWLQGARRLWFYDQYAVFVAETDASPQRTSQKLDAALEKWRTTSDDVVYSGPCGWFVSEEGRFERDD